MREMSEQQTFPDYRADDSISSEESIGTLVGTNDDREETPKPDNTRLCDAAKFEEEAKAKRKRALEGHSVRRPGPTTMTHVTSQLSSPETLAGRHARQLPGHFSPQEASSIFTSAKETEPSCVGPKCKFVKFVASDGHVFYVMKEAARVSKVIERLLDDPKKFADDEVQEFRFPRMESHVLQILSLFMLYVIGIRRRNLQADASIRNGNFPEFLWDDKSVFGVLHAAYFLEM